MYTQAKFLVSAASPADFPRDAGIEIAFAGRSNCGKSSAINAITGRRALARTSRTPGRTQLINFFELNAEERLVDLPGYGYARVSAATRDHWGELIGAYFARRGALAGVVLIMDARHPLKALDIRMLEHARGRGARVHVLLSKADKVGRSAGAATLASVRRELGAAATVQLFSALNRIGLDDARAAVADLLRHAPEGITPVPPDDMHLT